MIYRIKVIQTCNDTHTVSSQIQTERGKECWCNGDRVKSESLNAIYTEKQNWGGWDGHYYYVIEEYK